MEIDLSFKVFYKQKPPLSLIRMYLILPSML